VTATALPVAPPPNRTGSVACLGPHGFHRMHYVEWGAADAPHVVVCVHGLTRNGRDFDVIASRLSRHARVICPDIVGRGRSDRLADAAGYGYPQYLADVATLIARTGAEQVDWIGTSMGGLIGMFLAARAGTPIRRLVINDVGPFVPKASLERLAQYVGHDLRFDSLDAAEAWLRQVAAPFGPLTDPQWRHLATHSFDRQPDGRWASAYDPAIGDVFRGPIADVDLWALWPAVTQQVLVLRGAESDLLLADTAAQMAASDPSRIRLATFDQVGHAPMLMDDAQIGAVDEFLVTTRASDL
jgi:pimeloyl-ACP methyl ester carboxylesterase